MNKIISLAILLTLVSCKSGVKNKETNQIEGWSSEKLAEAKSYWSTMHQNGLVILANGNEVVNWGPTDKKVKLSSVRKSLISILYGNYVEQGIIDLDKSLKELNINDTPDSLSELEQSATVRMLMQARSGVYHSYVGGSLGMKKGQPERNEHQPGSYWYYNNWDFNTLGTIFEQETNSSIGVAFEETVGKQIGLIDFEPLDVYYVQSDQSMHRQYHFRMTARDLAKVGQLMVQNGQWDEKIVISPEWIEEMTSSYSSTNLGTGYGYMWWVEKDGVLLEDVVLPDNSYAAFGAMGKFLVIIPQHELIIAHVQMTEWPDNASFMPAAEVPNRETDENNRKLVGHLVKLILDSKLGNN